MDRLLEGKSKEKSVKTATNLRKGPEDKKEENV
jgi:hypothetical protein